MILFDGGVEVDRMVGALPKPLLQMWIEKAIGRRGIRRTAATAAHEKTPLPADYSAAE